jgi:N6-L-threonylcarbamoyladenine synthase
VLGIETSCDETGIGIVRGTTMLANVISSSMDEHARYGGVVPEIAARAPRGALGPAAHGRAGRSRGDAGRTRRHRRDERTSLSGALCAVGVGAAKALAIALDKPIYAINHLVGHVGADGLRDDGTDIQLPPSLLVSAAILLLHVRDLDRRHAERCSVRRSTMRQVRPSTSTSPAESSHPGGPQIDRGGRRVVTRAIRFPRGLSQPKDMAKHRYDFSFSGLKTAVARWVEQKRDAGEQVPVSDVAASFREAVADVLLTKAVAAAATSGSRLLLGGGVVANAPGRGGR